MTATLLGEFYIGQELMHKNGQRCGRVLRLEGEHIVMLREDRRDELMYLREEMMVWWKL